MKRTNYQIFKNGRHVGSICAGRLDRQRHCIYAYDPDGWLLFCSYVTDVFLLDPYVPVQRIPCF